MPDTSDQTDAQIRWPDISGRLVENAHILPIRVYFEDTDFSGLVYHANYIKWFERGRSDLLRLIGCDHVALQNGMEGRAPAAFVVRRIEVDYRAPARIDDLLTVETRLGDLAKAYCWLEQSVTRAGTVLATGRVQAALIGLETGRPQRMDGPIAAAFARFLPNP